MCHPQISVDAMRNALSEVALQGIEFWSNVCEEEIALQMEFEEVGTCFFTFVLFLCFSSELFISIRSSAGAGEQSRARAREPPLREGRRLAPLPHPAGDAREAGLVTDLCFLLLIFVALLITLMIRALCVSRSISD